MGTRENGESGRLLRFFISRALCNAAGRSVRCGTVRSGYPYLLLPFRGIRRRNGRGVGCRTDRGPVWRESCYPTFAAARLMQVFRQAFLQKGRSFPLHPLLSVAYITAAPFWLCISHGRLLPTAPCGVKMLFCAAPIAALS